MAQIRNKSSLEYDKYVGIEGGLQLANRMYISMDKRQADFSRDVAEVIVLYVIDLMRDESPAFDELYVDIFGGGSAYEGLKITAPDEFDIDLLMRLPEVTRPHLLPNNIPGYVNLQLENFQDLEFENPELFREMQTFVDDKNYLLTKSMKNNFIQSVFDRAVNNYLTNNTIEFDSHRFRIERVQNLGPAFTLTIEGEGRRLSVDLVPCIFLDGHYWPGEAFKENPYDEPSVRLPLTPRHQMTISLQDFFLVPKSPKRDLMPHIDRYWRLSFQKQEREIIFDRQWLKPTLRVLKRIRDCFGHKVSSYALKTIFLRELEKDNPDLDDETPDLWVVAPFSYCVVHMLEVYEKYLTAGTIPYFWNKKFNLLDNLTAGQIDTYRKDIEGLLQAVKDDPTPKTILKYLSKSKINL